MNGILFTVSDKAPSLKQRYIYRDFQWCVCVCVCVCARVRATVCICGPDSYGSMWLILTGLSSVARSSVCHRHWPRKRFVSALVRFPWRHNSERLGSADRIIFLDTTVQLSSSLAVTCACFAVVCKVGLLQISRVGRDAQTLIYV